MKTPINQILRCGLPAAVALIGLASTTLQAQTIVNRYEFGGNVTDSVGTANGTLSTNQTNTEAPVFGSITPTGVVIGGPTQSIEFGMNDGTKKSWFNLAGTVIQNQSAAGSVSMFLRPDATTSSAFRYAFTAVLTSGGFAIGQATVATNQVIRASVNNAPLGESTVTPSDWYHVALTWEQSGGNLIRTYYVNGSEVATSTATGSITGVTQVRVGTFDPSNNATNFTNQFDGRMYDLQVYSGVLSDSQVSSLALNPGSVIPEPSTWALLAGGMAMLTILRHRRGNC